LPDNVRYVFLSATIPNARQFAEWICYLHKQPCNVVYTEFRPTPLQHYIYPALGRQLHFVIDEKVLHPLKSNTCVITDNRFQGVLDVNNFDAAMKMLENPSRDKPKQKDLDRGPVYNVVKEVLSRNWAPVIVFNFSKYDCERHAMNMSDSDFNSGKIVNRYCSKELMNNICMYSRDYMMSNVRDSSPDVDNGIIDPQNNDWRTVRRSAVMG